MLLFWVLRQAFSFTWWLLLLRSICCGSKPSKTRGTNTSRGRRPKDRPSVGRGASKSRCTSKRRSGFVSKQTLTLTGRVCASKRSDRTKDIFVGIFLARFCTESSKKAATVWGWRVKHPARGRGRIRRSGRRYSATSPKYRRSGLGCWDRTKRTAPKKNKTKE